MTLIVRKGETIHCQNGHGPLVEFVHDLEWGHVIDAADVVALPERRKPRAGEMLGGCAACGSSNVLVSSGNRRVFVGFYDGKKWVRFRPERLTS